SHPAIESGVTESFTPMTNFSLAVSGDACSPGRTTLLECRDISVRAKYCRPGAGSAELEKFSALSAILPRTAPGESGRSSIAIRERVSDAVCACMLGPGAERRPNATAKIDSRAMKDFEIRSLFKK